MSINKVPPHDLDAEIAILSGMLNYPDNILQVMQEIHPDDLYREAHIEICRAFFALKKDSNLISIKDYLLKNDRLEPAGGIEYLMSLVEASSTAAGYRRYCEIVKDLSKRRRMITGFATLSEQCFNSHAEITEIIGSAKTLLSGITVKDLYYLKSMVDLDNVYTPERMIAEYEAYIDDLQKNRFITGIQEIDKRIRGVAGGETLFIIARAGCFKTAVLQNLLRNYVQHSSWGAAFFSIEMPVASIAERYHEIISGIKGKEVEEAYESSKQGYPEATEHLKKEFREGIKGIYVIPSSVSVKEVIQYIKIIEAEYRQKIGIIGIDYLGLMDSDGKGEYEKVSNISRELKSMAKLTNLPVIAICQTSRKAGSGETEVSLDMGRGSGAIEENADFVLGLFRDEEDVICKILKNRKGNIGTCWALELEKSTLTLGPGSAFWEAKDKDDKNYKTY